MMERTNAKGAGVHWDIVLLCLINCLGAFMGGPWICAATVRAVAHVSSLVQILCFKFSLDPLRFFSREKLIPKCQEPAASWTICNTSIQFKNNEIDPNQCQMTIFVQVYKIFTIVQLLTLVIFVQTMDCEKFYCVAHAHPHFNNWSARTSAPNLNFWWSHSHPHTHFFKLKVMPS